MDLSDFIAFVALAVSVFTFYWTSLREKKKFHLVRIDSYATRMSPEFALINSGNKDILVTSILCAFQAKDKKQWFAPEVYINGGGSSFTVPSEKTHYCKVTFDGKDMDERLAEGGRYQENGSCKLYHKDMLVIIEWLDSSGKEHKASAPILNYGFQKSGEMVIRRYLEKHHDLYQLSS